MGAYLSAPVTEKETFEGKGTTVTFGGSSMQGWRRTMEDAHLAEVALNADTDTAVFAVFDGHGGAEVAKFCQKYLAGELASLKEYEDGSIEESLVKVFHKIDDMLRDSRYGAELEALKTKMVNEEEEGCEEGDPASTMDALDLLKRVFQLKRFMGDSGAPASAAAAAVAASAAGGAAAGSTAVSTSGGAAAVAAGVAAGGPVTGGPGAALGLGGEASEEPTVQAGCTAVVAVKRNNELYVANAGDSRGVLCRAGKAIALSEDHKPASEGERMRIIAAGGFLSEIGGVCRVNGNLNLSRAIGDLKYKSNVELPAKDQIITAEPDIMRITITPQDRFFLLACDGVWDVMSNQDAVDFLMIRLDQGLSPSQAACSLLDACLANDPKEARGVGCDNMTAVVVMLTEHQPQQQGAVTAAAVAASDIAQPPAS